MREVRRSRAIGVAVGTLIGAGWLCLGLTAWPTATGRAVIGVAGLVIVGVLLRGAWAITALAPSPPAEFAGAGVGYRRASRRATLWFWVNFLVEIALLNVAVNLLAAPALHVYWIPAISLVVGLHFLPMARFFAVPSYWITGLAFIVGAALVAIVVHAGASVPDDWIAGEALFNACVLWATAAWGLRRRR